MNEKLNRRPGKQDWGNTPIKRDRKIRENIEYVRIQNQSRRAIIKLLCKLQEFKKKQNKSIQIWTG